MNVYENHDLFDLLSENPYAGRGIVIGKTPDGKRACVSYFIMGRSATAATGSSGKRTACY